MSGGVVDERVVEMRFDNRQFEQNVSTTMSTIDKLKQSLNLTGAAKGFEEVSAAAGRVNLSGLGSAAETVVVKFSHMQMTIQHYLNKIVDWADAAGKRMVAALTIDPVKTGFSEYETQINATQTILANTQSKGSTIDDVNTALEELNKYADLTIYNFTEMTRNIGTFTAAGIDLDTSVNAIQGIANLAAVSGSTSQQASTAMYQLSQALASGTVKLMDWNSVVNAGMGGEMFQNALKETSKELGTGAEAAIKATGSFRESLREGWLTADVLTETLKKFTTSGANEYVAEYTGLSKEAVAAALEEAEARYGEADAIEQASKALAEKSGKNAEEIESVLQFAKNAEDAATKVKTFSQLWDVMKEAAQSGWSKTWKLIVGDFEQAKSLLTPLADFFTGIINDISDARNNLLESALGTKITSFVDNISKVTKPVTETVETVKDLGEIVNKVINGDFGTGQARFDALTKAGYNYCEVQNKVNEQLGFSKRYTDEQIKAQDKLLGKQDESVTVQGKLSDAQKEQLIRLAGMTDAQDEQAIATADQVKQLKELNKQAQKVGLPLDEFIEKMDEIDGRWLLIEGLKNIGESIMSVFKTIGQAWENIFPPKSEEERARDLFDLLADFHRVTEKISKALDFEANTDTVDKLRRIFEGLFAVVDIVGMAIGAVVDGIFELVGVVAPAGDGIFTMAANLGDWLVGLRNSIKETNVFKRVIDGVVGFVDKFVEAVAKLYNAVRVKLTAPALGEYGSLLDRIKERITTLKDAVSSIKDAFVRAFDAICTNLENSNFFTLMGLIWGGVQKLGIGIADSLGSLIGVFADKLGNADFKGFFDIINTIIAGGIGLSIKNFFDGIGDVFENTGGILDKVKDTFDQFRGCLEAYQTQLKAGTLMQIASAIAILVAALVVVSLIDSEDLSAAIGGITMLFADLVGALAIIDKSSVDGKGLMRISGAMIGMSVGILIMASALKSLAELEFEQLFTGVVGIIMLSATMVQVVKTLGDGGKKVMTGATQLILFAVAIKILASACVDLAEIPFEKLVNGLGGVAALMAGVSLFLNNTKLGKGSFSAAVGLVVMAGAIKILASSCIDLAVIPFEQLINGLGAVVGLLGVVSVFINNTKSSNLISTGIGVIAIAAGIKILASCVTDMASLSWDDIAKGLAVIGGSLFGIGIALNMMPNNTLAIGAGLLLVSASVAILAQSIRVLSDITADQMLVSIAGLGGALVLLSGALQSMSGSLAGAGALAVACASLMLLVPVMTALGGMGWEEIVKGLVAIAGVFAIIGVAAYVLTPAAASIAALAGSFALISLSIIGIGAGLYLIAGAFTALAVAGTTGATAIVSALTIIIIGLLGLIPAIIESLADMIVAFCGVIASCAPAIGEAIKALVLSAIDVLVECVPPLVDGLLVLIAELLTSLAQHTPQIVDGLFKFILGLLDGLAEYIPQLIVSAMNVIGAFFQGVVDAISGIDTASLFKGIVGIALMSGLMLALSAVASLVPGAMIGVLGMGVVIAELALVLAAIGALAQIPGLEWLIGEGGDLLEAIGGAIGQFIGGLVGGLAEGVTSGLPGMGTNLSDFMTNVQPFVEGAKELDPAMLEGVRALAETILILTAANVLDGITSWLTGGNSLSDFATQLVPFGEAMKGYSEAIAGMDAEAVTASVIAAQSLVELANNLPNSGGIVSWFTGENDMDDFASTIVPFGEAMKDYSEAISGMDAEAVTASATAGKALVELANNLPNSGGIVSWFTGENDMDDFATKIVAFGEALNEYSKAVVDIDADAISSSVKAAKGVVEIANVLPNDGGMASWFVGENDMATFATGLVSFGSALSSYSTAVAGVDLSAVNTSVAAAKSVAGVVHTMSNINADGVTSFKTALDELATVNIQGIVEAFSNADTTVISAGADMIEALVDGIASKKTDVVGVMDDMIKAVLTMLTSRKIQFKVAGIETISNFINGISSHAERAQRVFTSVVLAISTAAKNCYASFHSAGAYLVYGFAAGIGANAYIAKAKARAMARAAADAAEDELDINSPSKVGEDIGNFFGMGFVNKLGEYADKAYNTSAEVAKSAKSGLSDAISKISDLVNSDIDSQPTIRPVLDLSNVQTGIGAINSMLDGSHSIGVSSNVSAISSMMNQRSQNGANSDVISAIDKLAARLDNIHGDTYQINGVTYDDGSNINTAVKTIVRAARIERRV